MLMHKKIKNKKKIKQNIISNDIEIYGRKYQLIIIVVLIYTYIYIINILATCS